MNEPDCDVLSKTLSEGIEDKGVDIDATPFIKALVDTLELQISELIKVIINLSDKVESLENKMKE